MVNNLPQSISIYVHIPWCVRKCHYCDFNSFVSKSEIPEQLYVDTLIRDLDNTLPLIKNRTVKSIFFGGGTPSLFAPSSIQFLINAIKKRLNVPDNIEITLEANPGTLDNKNIISYSEIGITRLSLGIQSMNNTILKKIGRVHSDEDSIKAISIIKKANFKSTNFDLIYGLPDHSIDIALQDLKTIIKFNPSHISWYQLAIEPNTAFYKRPPKLPSEGIVENIENSGLALLEENGFNRYEISAFSKKNKECIHNINYWEFGDYVGIGAGAHSKITSLNPHTITRIVKIKHPKAYLDPNKMLIDKSHSVSSNDACFEFMLNRFRLLKPVSIESFEESTNCKFKDYSHLFEKAQENKLLVVNNNEFYPTDLGNKFLNDLIEIFMPNTE